MAQPNIISADDDIELEPEPTDAAFEATLPEITALPDAETEAVNIDPVAAATIVLGLLPELAALRPQIAKELPGFDLQRFDKLRQYALAFSHAHGLYRGAQVPKGQVVLLATELGVIRDRLLADALSLANNGFFDGARLKDCKKVVGYRALASDILTIVPVFKERWPSIEGKTPVTRAALSDATRRAVELMAIVGLKDQGPDVTSEVAVRRAKAFTLFLRAYEDARHAVEFLRRGQGDAAEIAPSLYAGRGGRPRSVDAAEAAPASEPPDEAEGAGPATKRAEAPAAILVNNPRGLPIDNPFTQ